MLYSTLNYATPVLFRFTILQDLTIPNSDFKEIGRLFLRAQNIEILTNCKSAKPLNQNDSRHTENTADTKSDQSGPLNSKLTLQYGCSSAYGRHIISSQFNLSEKSSVSEFSKYSTFKNFNFLNFYSLSLQIYFI